MKRQQLRDVVLMFSCLLAAAGCSSVVKSHPEVSPQNLAFTFPGHIEYEGNPVYVPTVLRESDLSDVVFRFDNDVTYRHSSNAQALNILIYFGGRFIGVNVTAHATLVVEKEGEVIRSYEETNVVKMRRSVWSWSYPDQSELRRKALLNVRDMIDAALLKDRAPLSSALGL